MIGGLISFDYSLQGGRRTSYPKLIWGMSVYYFVPLIEELLETPLPKGYSRYLERKIAAFSTHRCQDSRSKDLRPSPDASSKTRTF